MVAAVSEAGPGRALDWPAGGGGEVGEPFSGDGCGHGDDVLHVAEPGLLGGGDHLRGVGSVVRPVWWRGDRDDGRAARGLQPDARGEQPPKLGRPGGRVGERVPQGDQARGAGGEPVQLVPGGDRDVA